MTNVYTDIHRELIERSKQGNRKAQKQLYGLYSKAMYNICIRYMNNMAEAEDMLQEAFTEAFLKLHTFRHESAFGAWLKRIVVHKCINEIKRRKAELVYTDKLHDNQIEEESVNEDEINYEVSRVYEAIQKLPDGYRVSISLYLLEGYDHAEIAEILNVSESTSKSQYMRAKRKVIELLKNEQHG